MKRSLGILLVASPFLLSGPLHATDATKLAAARPNIIVIASDDMGYADIGSYGRKDIPTPNIDSLAKQGVRFTDSYENGSFCTLSSLESSPLGGG